MIDFYTNLLIRKKAFLKKTRREILDGSVLEAKVYEFRFLSVPFCTGTPSFPCFDVLTETKNKYPRA